MKTALFLAVSGWFNAHYMLILALFCHLSNTVFCCWLVPIAGCTDPEYNENVKIRREL